MLEQGWNWNLQDSRCPGAGLEIPAIDYQLYWFIYQKKQLYTSYIKGLSAEDKDGFIRFEPRWFKKKKVNYVKKGSNLTHDKKN